MKSSFLHVLISLLTRGGLTGFLLLGGGGLQASGAPGSEEAKSSTHQCLRTQTQ